VFKGEEVSTSDEGAFLGAGGEAYGGDEEEDEDEDDEEEREECRVLAGEKFDEVSGGSSTISESQWVDLVTALGVSDSDKRLRRTYRKVVSGTATLSMTREAASEWYVTYVMENIDDDEEEDDEEEDDDDEEEEENHKGRDDATATDGDGTKGGGEGWGGFGGLALALALALANCCSTTTVRWARRWCTHPTRLATKLIAGGGGGGGGDGGGADAAATAAGGGGRCRSTLARPA
jgi:hypothetical protein